MKLEMMKLTSLMLRRLSSTERRPVPRKVKRMNVGLSPLSTYNNAFADISCTGAAMYTTFVTEFLEELELRSEAVIGYLIGDITGINNGISQGQSEMIRLEALPQDFDFDDLK